MGACRDAVAGRPAWLEGIDMEDPDGSRVFDPICGMWLCAGEIAITFTYLGQTYSFCCVECRDLFASAPEIYVANLAHEPDRSAGYRCPFQCRADGCGTIPPKY